VGVLLRRWTKRIGDRLQHAGAVPKNVVVPEAKDAPPLRAQPCIAKLVIARGGMLPAIGFNDHARFNAREIEHIRWNRELSPKAPT
jgi:hypothetical protein